MDSKVSTSMNDSSKQTGSRGMPIPFSVNSEFGRLLSELDEENYIEAIADIDKKLPTYTKFEISKKDFEELNSKKLSYFRNHPDLLINYQGDDYTDTMNADEDLAYKNLIKELISLKHPLNVDKTFLSMLLAHKVQCFKKLKGYSEWSKFLILACKAYLNDKYGNQHDYHFSSFFPMHLGFDVDDNLLTDKVDLHALYQKLNNKTSFAGAIVSTHPLFLSKCETAFEEPDPVFSIGPDSGYARLSDEGYNDKDVSLILMMMDQLSNPIKQINILEFLNNVLTNVTMLSDDFSNIEGFVYEYDSITISISLLPNNLALVKHPFIFTLLQEWAKVKGKIIPHKFIYRRKDPEHTPYYTLPITDMVRSSLTTRFRDYVIIPKDFFQASSTLLSISIGDVATSDYILVPYAYSNTVVVGAAIMYCPILASIPRLYASVGRAYLNPKQCVEKINLGDKLDNELGDAFNQLFATSIRLPTESIITDHHVTAHTSSSELCSCIMSSGQQVNACLKKETQSYSPLKRKAVTNNVTKVSTNGVHMTKLNEIKHEVNSRCPILSWGYTSGCNAKITFGVANYLFPIKLFTDESIKEMYKSRYVQVLTFTGSAATVIANRAVTNTIAVCYDMLVGSLTKVVEEKLVLGLRTLGYYALPLNETRLQSIKQKAAKNVDGAVSQLTSQILEKLIISLHLTSCGLPSPLSVSVNYALSHQNFVKAIYKTELDLHLPSASGAKLAEGFIPVERHRVNSRNCQFESMSLEYRSRTNQCAKATSAAEINKDKFGCRQLTIFNFIDLYRNHSESPYNCYGAFTSLMSKLVGHVCLIRIFFRKPPVTGAKDACCRYCKTRFDFWLQGESCLVCCKYGTNKRYEKIGAH